MAGNLFRRGKKGLWSVRVFVPKKYLALTGKLEIWRSLGTDSREDAEPLARDIERALLAEWELRLLGRIPEAEVDAAARYRATAEFAEAQGLRYQTARELAAGDLGEALYRVGRLREADPKAEDTQLAAAYLGGVEPPKLRLSELVAEVETLSAHDNRFKNVEQMRQWRRERVRAVASLRKALGGRDPFVLDIDAGIAAHHLAWARKEFQAGRRGMESLNKEFVYLSSMLTIYRQSLKELDPPRPYAKVVLTDKHREPADPVPLSGEWSLEHIVQDGALLTMNDEARDILVICAETGCRPSEVYNVPSGDICLDHEIPHFWVRNSDADEDETRQVKSAESKRRVPLTGASLAAMRRHPQGFPRYRGTRNFSAIASKHLKDKHPLGATPKGLRHGFENRMTDAAFPNPLAAYMIGHSVKAVRGRSKYGDLALEKRRFLQDLLSLSWCEWPRPKEVAVLQGTKLADLL